MRYMIKDNLFLIGRPGMRRAVARQGFSPGDSITICPTITLSKHDLNCVKKTKIKDRLFSLQNEQILFALGYGSLCLPVDLQTDKINAQAIFDSNTNAIEIVCSNRIIRGEKVLCSPEINKQGAITRSITDKKTEVRESQGKGRGIFALKSYSPRSVIERYPVLVVPASESSYIFDSIFDLYHSGWGYGNIAIPLGLWMLHNTTTDGSTRTTNASYCLDYKTRTVVNYCIKPIAVGEEITIPYRGLDEPLSKLEMYGIVQ